jgi:hypothetical protein
MFQMINGDLLAKTNKHTTVRVGLVDMVEVIAMGWQAIPSFPVELTDGLLKR